ncbi:D-aspartate oxidase-like [Sycon ciliatum]|uniref:D-aspartate oxidase-like n=1 Tax=Sycon ciliatum TaxID=27933 RepID=UPI0031F6147D
MAGALDSPDKMSQGISTGLNTRKTCNICVLGAGCIGLSSAIALAESVGSCRNASSRVTITVLAENFHPHTTSNVAAGIWEPYDIKTTPAERGERWCRETLHWMQRVYHSDMNEAEKIGILSCPLTSVQCSADSVKGLVQPVDALEKFGCDVRRLSDNQVASYGMEDLQSGFHLQTTIADTSYLLPWMMRRCKQLGVAFEKRSVQRLTDLSGEFDAVINCCGLPRSLLTDDQDAYPIGGQVVRVHAPWVTEATLMINSDGKLTYVIPQVDCVVLGGTYKRHDWNLEEDKGETAGILQRCSKVIPSLRDAVILRVDVGLRPARSSGIRLESQRLFQPTSGRDLFVVHNYGHAGCGITVHYGCAKEAASIMMQWLGTQIVTMENNHVS